MINRIFLSLLFLACTPSAAPKDLTSSLPKEETSTVSTNIQAVVSANDRTPKDRELDPGRKPEKLLSFFGIQPGMKVAELGAGTGYTAELLARVVGKTGVVYAQNSEFILTRFAEKPWSERLSKPVMSNVIRVDREFDSPLPEEAKDLDAVFLILFYHDTVWFETDRQAMNQAVFDALKPGGVYAIVDHNAKEGEGIQVAKTLHRIEQSVLQEELETVGFRLKESADFLKNPQDQRDWNAAPGAAGNRRGTSDRFVLKFVKPQ